MHLGYIFQLMSMKLYSKPRHRRIICNLYTIQTLLPPIASIIRSRISDLRKFTQPEIQNASLFPIDWNTGQTLALRYPRLGEAGDIRLHGQR